MGIYDFAKKTFKADFKNSLFYIFSISITVAFMFNAINLAYNQSIYSTKGEVVVEKATDYIGVVESFVYPIPLLQKQNLLILVFVATFFAVICNKNHIKRKGKEIAFAITNGASIVDVSRYLMYINGRTYIIGASIGLVIGLILTPIFNTIMYKFLGSDGPLFTFDTEGLLIVAVYVVIQYLLLVSLNFGYAYRKEIIDLMKVENTKGFTDSRNVRVPGTLFLILYLIPIVYSLTLPSFEGAEGAAYVSFILGSIGVYGIIKYFIPKIIKNLKKKRFMYKGLRRIYISNFEKMLSDSLIYVLALTIALNYFANSIVEYIEFDGMKGNLMFCIFGTSLIVGLSLFYKLMVETDEKMKLYNQLKILGYSKEEVVEILKKEYLLFYSIALLLPISLLIGNLIIYTCVGAYTITLTVQVLVIVFVPLVLAGIVSSMKNREKIVNQIFN
ncbi:FtsX-like permease family protein [Clostridium sp.]|uniref:FtsX-like permease family protein n=1 Tax=Clostridium sp. TaxID=1506 RepID=UPI002FC7D137